MHKRKKRMDKYYRAKEKDLLCSRSNPTNLDELIKYFHQQVAKGPEYVSEVCQQLCYKKSVCNLSNVHIPLSDAESSCLTDADTINGHICRTCLRYLKQKKKSHLVQFIME